jgi:hypothetical protein
MRRREFITLLDGTAAWPLAARTQQDGRVRRIGWLIGRTERDSEARRAALKEALGKLGWIEGRNLGSTFAMPVTTSTAFVRLRAELVSLAPDVIVTEAAVATRAARAHAGHSDRIGGRR